MSTADEAILQAVERLVLNPDVVERALAEAVAQLLKRDEESDDRRDQVVTELRQVETELARFAEAVGSEATYRRSWRPCAFAKTGGVGSSR